MNKITEEEKDKLQAAIQENIKLQQDLKDIELKNKTYEEQYNILQQEKLNNVRLKAEYEKASQIRNYQDTHKLDDEIKNIVIENAQKEKQIEQMKMVAKAKDNLGEANIKVNAAQAAIDYYGGQQSIEIYNQLINLETKTNDVLKLAEDYNNLAKAKKALRESNIEMEKAKYLSENDDASFDAQIAYHERKISEIEKNK